ncbi:hypothetical protein [Streptomyces sp. NPDC005953]|uniref:hypothetical protein n=1 Tax=Streptomyces sp. NPDC005953 TaxID=3156719 RepID=UPI0033F8FC95
MTLPFNGDARTSAESLLRHVLHEQPGKQDWTKAFVVAVIQAYGLLRMTVHWRRGDLAPGN